MRDFGGSTGRFLRQALREGRVILQRVDVPAQHDHQAGIDGKNQQRQILSSPSNLENPNTHGPGPKPIPSVMSETPKYGLYPFLNYRPFKPLLNYQHCRFWRSFLIGSPKHNRNYPPLSTLSIHHDTLCLHQQAFLPPMARTHANALSTEVTQNRMAQRHHLSKALVVSLMKNIYSNKGFCRGKRKTFDLEVC